MTLWNGTLRTDGDSLSYRLKKAVGQTLNFVLCKSYTKFDVGGQKLENEAITYLPPSKAPLQSSSLSNFLTLQWLFQKWPGELAVPLAAYLFKKKYAQRF